MFLHVLLVVLMYKYGVYYYLGMSWTQMGKSSIPAAPWKQFEALIERNWSLPQLSLDHHHNHHKDHDDIDDMTNQKLTLHILAHMWSQELRETESTTILLKNIIYPYLTMFHLRTSLDENLHQKQKIILNFQILENWKNYCNSC